VGGASQLLISTVDSLGNVTGTFTGQLLGSVQGFWDEDAQKLLLLVTSALNTVIGVFVGYLFTDTVNLTGVTGSVIFTLAGEFESFSPLSAPTAKRSTFGWYAQIGVD
jgi:hypothetical protein